MDFTHPCHGYPFKYTNQVPGCFIGIVLGATLQMRSSDDSQRFKPHGLLGSTTARSTPTDQHSRSTRCRLLRPRAGRKRRTTTPQSPPRPVGGAESKGCDPLLRTLTPHITHHLHTKKIHRSGFLVKSRGVCPGPTQWGGSRVNTPPPK